MAGMPGIVIQIGADTKEAIDGINRVRGAMGDSLSGFEKFRAGVDKAFVPALAAIGGLTVAAVDFAKAAAEDDRAARILAKTMQNVTGATSDQIAAMEDYISATAASAGIADDQLRPALGRIIRSTEDATKAQELLDLALNISAATGKDVETVSAALAKSYDGSSSSLGRLGLGIDAAILKTGDFTKIQASLSEKFKGFAEQDANSAEGQMRRFAIAIDETKENIGAALLPALNQVIPYIRQMAEWAQANSDVLLKVGAAVGALAGVIVVLKGVLTTVTVAQQALNLAMSLNPIGLVVIAIAALVAALIYLYNNNETVRKAIDAAWQGIQNAINSVVQWFQNTAWPAIKTVLGYLQTAFNAYLTVVKTVWTGVQAAADLVARWFNEVLVPAFSAIFALLRGDWSGFIGYIKDLWNGLISFLGGIVGRFAEIGEAIVEGLKRGISNAWSAFTGWMRGLFDQFIGSVLSIFGINSPSRVFMEIGQQIVAGYSKGLSGMAGVNTAVLTGANSLVAGMPTAAPATAYATAGMSGGTPSDEQLARALWALLSRSDLRNGRTVAIA